MPVRKDDEVSVTRGTFKVGRSISGDQGATRGAEALLFYLQGREGKVITVYRKKWVIHIERLTREKVNGEFTTIEVFTGIAGHPSCFNH